MQIVICNHENSTEAMLEWADALRGDSLKCFLAETMFSGVVQLLKLIARLYAENPPNYVDVLV